MAINHIKTKGRIVLQSQISDSFEGFNDAMLFQLNNGQFWIQKENKYWHHYEHRPRVTIYLYSGSYYLTIDGQTEFVAVEQLTDVLERTIVSDFKGWSGDTIFELDNRQIWKQDTYAYHYSYSYRPKAIIYRSGSGYKMIVNGSSLKVKRIK